SRSRPARPEKGAMLAVCTSISPLKSMPSSCPDSAADSTPPAMRNCASSIGAPAFHSPAMPSPMLSPKAASTASLALMPESAPSRGRVGKVDRHAIHLALQRFGGTAGHFETGDGERRAPVFRAVIAEIDMQLASAQPRGVARYRQGDLAAGGIGNDRVELE